jgi:hypothetical protein
LRSEEIPGEQFQNIFCFEGGFFNVPGVISLEVRAIFVDLAVGDGAGANGGEMLVHRSLIVHESVCNVNNT